MMRAFGSLAAAALLAAALAAGPAAGQTLKRPAAPPPIDAAGALALIRSSLIALDQANKSGNYTVLRDLGAPGFRANTAARLAEIFANQRRDRLDLAFAAALEPQMTLSPQLDASGMLHMAGVFPVSPAPVNFDLLFQQQDAQWRLFGVSVGLGQGAPAPQQQAQRHAAPALKP